MYRHFVAVVLPIVFEQLNILADVIWRGTLYAFNIFLRQFTTIFNMMLNGAMQLYSTTIWHFLDQERTPEGHAPESESERHAPASESGGHIPESESEGHAPAEHASESESEGHAPARKSQGHTPARKRRHAHSINAACIQPSVGMQTFRVQLLFKARPHDQSYAFPCCEGFIVQNGKPVTSIKSKGGPPVSYEHSVSHDLGLSYDDGVVPDELCEHQLSYMISRDALVEKSRHGQPFNAAIASSCEPIPNFEVNPVQEDHRY